MSALTLQDLLEAGAHFGHQTKRWNPKMQRFILCPRNGIYIVDLNKTLQGLDDFIQCVKNEVQKGGKVLKKRSAATCPMLPRDGSGECSQIFRRSGRVFPNLKK